MVIQAGGARRLLRSDPARARDSILTVERTGREALADMRRLLGMLRKDEDQRALAPQPGLGQLASLLDSMRQAGLACELRTEGEPIDLTPGLDLVGYRVIEAALLSAAHHRSSHVMVTVRYGTERLELDVRGDGSVPELERELHGISERVALYDGSLRAVPADGDGFALRARLPLTAAIATVPA
jgi:signal transduction histidine kinase